ncbi:MAG: hypothetical protein AB1634_04470 [Thermodesulfobacteriota bacterium]
MKKASSNDKDRPWAEEPQPERPTVRRKRKADRPGEEPQEAKPERSEPVQEQPAVADRLPRRRPRPDRFAGQGEGFRPERTRPWPDEQRPHERFDRRKTRPERYPGASDNGTVVSLDPDVAEVFPSSEAVNRVLRAIIRAMPKTGGRPPRTGPPRSPSGGREGGWR